MSQLTDKLGFYFLIYQRASVNSTLFKCNIDGSDKPTYFTEQEILNFCNQEGYDGEVENKLKNSFDTASIYLWDVENRIVRRLSPGYNFENLRLERLNLKNFKNPVREEKTPQIYVNNNYLNIDGKGTLKITH